jgi:hypothetical protein
MKNKQIYLSVVLMVLFIFCGVAQAWTPLPVKQDPLVRMPGTQPPQENNITLEAPTRCTNCHGGFNTAIEPAFNWKGSMMAQSARDPLFWACLTVSAQDSIWAVGRPNATDICLRCHFPQGWVEGRSDPTNAASMTGDDFSGVHCDVCHHAYDPFFQTTFNGTREGSDWKNYWDETNLSGTPSNSAALKTYNADKTLSQTILTFNKFPFYGLDNLPLSLDYTENASGQMFLSGTRDKRASFADASARHNILYSRYHKSKYFCSTCHDVSNPVLANLGADPSQALPTEVNPAHSYFHVERTFSEFMLSAYAQQGGSAGIGPFAPSVFKTSYPNNYIAKCQDCHMKDGVGKACSQNDGVNRPTGSIEHPNSGQPVHDMTGGNAWVSYILASTITGSPNYNLKNDQLLRQGASVLTLDLTLGEPMDATALLAGVNRAKQQLQMAASIQNASYSPATGSLSFRIQNQTGHKLISGFPEGRRMFVNIKAYDSSNKLIYEVNPYDYEAGTLRGMPASQTLGPNEAHVDELVYEMKPKSDLTGESKTFHFALATGRYKDNRIPPKGFRINEAADRLSVPVSHGIEDPSLFTAAEYAGGYDDVSLSIPAGAAFVEINLYYQTTSREYIEFLRDEINGTGNLTLSSPTPSGELLAYVAQSDPFFTKLKAWGNTIWQLWDNNKNVDGAKPFLMAQAIAGSPPPPPCNTPGTPLNLTAQSGLKRSVKLTWSPGTPAPTTGGYQIYYDQNGKLVYRATVGTGVTTYTDTGLNRSTTYCYRITAWEDCNGNGLFDSGTDTESPATTAKCATTSSK